MYAKRTTLYASLLILGTAVESHAQGSPADYERADSLPQRVQGRVARGRVEPNWLDGGSRFWYRVELGGGRKEFIFVDPPARARRPAFDHQKLAGALSKALGQDISADRLPFDSARFDADMSAVHFAASGKNWTVDLKTYEMKESTAGAGPRAGLPPLQRIRPSIAGTNDTEITFINRRAEPVEIFWVDLEGHRQSYGVVTAGTSQSQHTFEGHVWLAARRSGEAIAAFRAAATPATAVIDDTLKPPAPPKDDAARAPARWKSPNGAMEAVIRDFNVVIRDSASGRETPLTKDGKKEDAYEAPLVWSPDSKRLVVMKTIPAEDHRITLVESSPKDQVQPRYHSIEYLKPGDRIAHPRPKLFVVETGQEVDIKGDLFPNPWEITELRWEPDGRRFTFLYNQRGHQAMRVVAVDAAAGTAAAVIDEESKTFIDWTNKVYYHSVDSAREAIWMSERDGWNHLYLYDTTSGKVKHQITSGAWVVRKVDRVDDKKRQIWFEAGGLHPAEDPYYVHFCRVAFDGTGLTDLTPGDGTHEVKYSPDGKYIVDTWSRVDLPPVTELRGAESGEGILELERSDASALTATGWRVPERFAAKGRDGKTDIYGVIFRPSSFDPAKRYPVIESIYAGPHGSFVPKAWSAMHGAQSVAELGFIVVQIDGMGTNNRSKAFHDVCFKNLADGGLPDRVAWIRAAAAVHPEMDITRVGIYGTSAGGQNALAGILSYPELYKACVADCGCHDNRMDKIWWNEQWMGWPVGPEYAANSNVTMAPKLRGKLLLMVGEMDSNVDPASTMQVVNALIKADKDFELLVMPGQGHGVMGSPYGRRRMRDFFVRTLLGVDPPNRNAMQ